MSRCFGLVVSRMMYMVSQATDWLAWQWDVGAPDPGLYIDKKGSVRINGLSSDRASLVTMRSDASTLDRLEVIVALKV